MSDNLPPAPQIIFHDASCIASPLLRLQASRLHSRGRQPPASHDTVDRLPGQVPPPPPPCPAATRAVAGASGRSRRPGRRRAAGEPESAVLVSLALSRLLRIPGPVPGLRVCQAGPRRRGAGRRRPVRGADSRRTVAARHLQRRARAEGLRRRRGGSPRPGARSCPGCSHLHLFGHGLHSKLLK